MKKLLTAACTLSLGVAATPAIADNPPYNIPGQYCKGVSKKKLPGQKKTPFAQCVTAMASMQKRPGLSPARACAGLNRGARGKAAKQAAARAYSQCVSGGRKLRADQSSDQSF
jgi:hypothetical protein